MVSLNKPVRFLMYSLMIVAALFVVLNSAALAKAATAPSTVWEQQIAIGTTASSGEIHSVWQTSDGGYILGGIDKDANANNGFRACLIKTDAAGVKEWERFYGEDHETGTVYKVQQSSDGGYVFVADYGGAGSIWLVKTDTSGNLQWQIRTSTADKASDSDDNHTFLYSVRQTSDGGYIATGFNSVRNDHCYAWLLKLDKDGNKQWAQSYRFDTDANYPVGYDVWQTSDGGYVIAGDSQPGSGAQFYNIWKTDANGVVQWKNTCGNGILYGVQQTRDGGYIAVGGDVSNANVIKADAQGNLQWRYDQPGYAFYSVQQTWDGGYVVCGNSNNAGNTTLLIVKLDSSGNKEWEKWLDQISGYRIAEGSAVQQIGIGNFLVVGNALAPGKMDRYTDATWNGVFYNLSSDMTPVPNAQFVSDTIPAVWEAGSTKSVSLTFLNTGSKPWTVQDNTTMSPVVGTDAALFGATTNVSPQVAAIVRPGQSYTFTVSLTAPAMNGSYYPEFQMVWEGHNMFGDVDLKNITVVDGTNDTRHAKAPVTSNSQTSTPTTTATSSGATVTTTPSATQSQSSSATTSGSTKKSGLPCLSSVLIPLMAIGVVTVNMNMRRKR